MTTGECIIDGTDIATLGMFIERDGSNNLLSFPTRRNPDENDWNEEDGIEVDLSVATFDAKKIIINYVMMADNYNQFKERLKAFEMLHYQPGERSIYVREYATTFVLRFSAFTDYRHKGGYYNPARKIARIAVEYWMDNPLQIYTDAISSPVGAPARYSNVSLNGVDLSKYGIIVNEVYSSSLKPRSVKDVLTRKVSVVDGQMADDGEIGDTGVFVSKKKKSRELSIDCTMIADSTNSLLINMNALFNVLKSQLPVSLKLAYESMFCYYTKMSRFKKRTVFSRKVCVEFTIQMREVSWMELKRLLATQSGLVIIAQDGKLIMAI